jgi:hypothetical protein
MNNKVVTVSVALLALWPFANPITADAKPITEAEKRHCEQAYHKYYGEYGLESNALRNCMSRNGRALPHACIEALIDAGEVSRSEVERQIIVASRYFSRLAVRLVLSGREFPSEVGGIWDSSPPSRNKWRVRL